MKVFKSKRSVVKGEFDGIENYLRSEFGLLDEVSLNGTADGGMHGNRKVVWNTPNGEVECRAYYSQGLVRTIKMSISGEEDAKKLFGCSLSELRERRDKAKTGFEDV